MNLYAKLIISLALTSAVASGLLAVTFSVTAPKIAEREREDRGKALQDVFFLQMEERNGGRFFTLTPRELDDGVTALYLPDNPNEPAYFAVVGEGMGYNASVPITLMVGFTGLAKDAATLLQGYVDESRLPQAGKKGNFIVGFSVVSSEETPGLGEKIKDVRPPFTWAQFVTGNRPPPNPDTSTEFQRQFRGRLADTLVLRKNGGDLDAITASTITSNGVLLAIQDASERLATTLLASAAGN